MKEGIHMTAAADRAARFTKFGKRLHKFRVTETIPFGLPIYRQQPSTTDNNRQQPTTTDNKPTITDNNRQWPRSTDKKCCLA